MHEKSDILAVSVIIPVYNRAKIIGRALDSVLNQTMAASEIIVVDDGSTDDTAEVVASRYPRVKLARQANLGLSAARNTGIRMASGEFIALLDSDDAWLPDKLKTQLEVLSSRLDLGLLATRKYKNRSNHPIKRVAAPIVRYFPFHAFLKRTWFHPSSVLIPRRIFAEAGGFDESLRAAEDWDMWARIAYRYPVARIEQPLLAVFEMEDSISRDRRHQYSYDIEIITRWNPRSAETYDINGRIDFFAYQRYITTFAILRGMRLHRHLGREAVHEFIQLFERKADLTPAAHALIHMALKCMGCW